MLVTPFQADGAVAFDELAALADHQLAAGVSGLSLLGLAAEANMLTGDERNLICRTVLSRASGTPVIVGCSAPTTAEAVSLAREAAGMGAAVIMIAPPTSKDWSRDRLKEHYAQVAAAIAPVPLMVQDAPAFLGVSLEAHFVQELCGEHENIRFAKPESVPASDAIAELAPVPNIRIFAGHGGLYFLEALQAGAHGLIPGCEQPENFQRIFACWEKGDLDGARRCFSRILPLLVWQFQSLECYIASVKYILGAKGILKHPSLRNKLWPLAKTSEGILLDHAKSAGGVFP